MFAEISVWSWMGMAIVFSIGAGTGFFIARQIKDKQTLELEANLTTARNELAGYRGEVNQHFLKTSLLLGKLTNDYREVYEHLATGAQKLCNEKPHTPKLDLPETRILPSAGIIENATPAIAQTDGPDTNDRMESQQNEQSESENTPVASDETKEANEVMEELHSEASREIAGHPDVEKSETKEPTSKHSSTKNNAKQADEPNDVRPAPEDIPDNKENDDDVHLGADSTPGVDAEFHKTHPAIH